MTSIRELFLHFIRLGVGELEDVAIDEGVKWNELEALAEQQGLNVIIFDGVQKLPEPQRPPKVFFLQWLGDVLQVESISAGHHKAAAKLSSAFQDNYIRTYVLKGEVVAECYPRPDHRESADFDCFLLPDQGHFDAWALGNDIVRNQGFKVNSEFYKNSWFSYSGLRVENHKFLIPFRGNRHLASLERKLESAIKNDKGEDRIEGTWLYRPPVMMTALFLIEHAYSHFLHEGLTWRHVLDWMLFSRRHNEKIDWPSFHESVKEYGFSKFYDSYNRLGLYLLGALSEQDLTGNDKRMLSDIWADLDIHKSVSGIRGKLALVGNTLRAGWKYRYFSELSMIRALWIQVSGFLFEKNPSL